jgi:hypothetical protein
VIAVVIDPEGMENAALRQLEADGISGESIVAFAIVANTEA